MTCLCERWHILHGGKGGKRAAGASAPGAAEAWLGPDDSSDERFEREMKKYFKPIAIKPMEANFG